MGAEVLGLVFVMYPVPVALLPALTALDGFSAVVAKIASGCDCARHQECD